MNFNTWYRSLKIDLTQLIAPHIWVGGYTTFIALQCSAECSIQLQTFGLKTGDDNNLRFRLAFFGGEILTSYHTSCLFFLNLSSILSQDEHFLFPAEYQIQNGSHQR